MSKRQQVTPDIIQFAGTRVKILLSAASNEQAFSLLRVASPPGCWTPPHRHRAEDETVFVISGTLTVITEDRTVDLGAGEALVLPRGRPHRLGNGGADVANVLVHCTPGGFDDFVRSSGLPFGCEGPEPTDADVARLVQNVPRYDIELLPSDSLRPVDR